MIKKISTETRENVLKSAEDQGIDIPASCRYGACGLCEIKIVSGNLSEPTDEEVNKLGENKVKDGYRLACQCSYQGELQFEL